MQRNTISTLISRIWCWVTAYATIFWVRSDKFLFDVGVTSLCSVLNILRSAIAICEKYLSSASSVIRVPRFTEVRYHCRSAKSYRSSGPDLKARRAGRCDAGKTMHAYGVAACNNSAIDYPGPGSHWKQVHFRKTALVLYLAVYSIYSPSSPPVRPPILGQALSKRTLRDGTFPDYRLDYAETQRRQGDARLRSDSSSPFTSREFLPPLVHPLAYVAARIASRRYGDYTWQR